MKYFFRVVVSFALFMCTSKMLALAHRYLMLEPARVKCYNHQEKRGGFFMDKVYLC